VSFTSQIHYLFLCSKKLTSYPFYIYSAPIGCKMSVNYISRQLTEEEYFKKVFEKGKSESSEKKARTVVNNLEYFTQDKYKKSRFEVLKDLKEDLDKTQDTDLVLRFFQHFIDWLGEDHPEIKYFTHENDKAGRPIIKKNPEVIRAYAGIIKRYVKLCHGIKIDNDDFQEWLTVPVDDSDDEEPEPFLKEELKLILDNIQDPRRKSLFMVIKDTRLRIMEALRLKKKYFDLTTDPATVRIPRSIQKNKRTSKTRTAYLCRETVPGVAQELKKIDDEDLVFTDNPYDISARNNEIRLWRNRANKLGFTQKKSSGHLKKNIHSIGSFTITALKEATKDPDYAHGYAGHTRYLQQYLRLPKERQIELFRQSEPYLSLYENTVVVVDESQELKEIKEKLEKYKVLDDILDNLDQPKLERLLQNLSSR